MQRMSGARHMSPKEIVGNQSACRVAKPGDCFSVGKMSRVFADPEMSMHAPDRGVDVLYLCRGLSPPGGEIGLKCRRGIKHYELLGHGPAKLDHFTELPRRVDVERRNSRLCRKERLLGEVQHDRAVLADRIQHHRALA